jgi:nucleotide-binding universal stress UspA family protein
VKAQGVTTGRAGIDGTELATYLARHCRKVSLTQLPPAEADDAKSLKDHAIMTRADLMVMGAYAHSRMWQRVLVGVTREMLDHAPLPVIMSY